MALGLISIRGSDIYCRCGDVAEARIALSDSRDRLALWSARYNRATAIREANITPSQTMAELMTIGREMFNWLNASGWVQSWADEGGDRVLEIQAAGDSADEIALLDAPWELLATDKGPFALNDLQLFVVARRTTTRSDPPTKPNAYDFRMLFMAASPENQTLLDYEGEEAAIAEATSKAGRVHLFIEETGECDEMHQRLVGHEGPFEALHLSCHGDIDPERGPFLALEDEFGRDRHAYPADIVRALGGRPPPLVMLSACRTAEQGGGDNAAMPFARQLGKQVANIVGWDGSVFDSDAIKFAQTFYNQLGGGETVPRAAALARQDLLRLMGGDQQHGQHWHLARVYIGPGGGGALCDQNAAPLPVTMADTPRAMLGRKVPVASREAFVGRRREIKRILRALREQHGDVLIHGMGALGKSSLAERVRSRMAREACVIFGGYDALKIFDALIESLPAEQRRQPREIWRDQIIADDANLREALETLLTGPFNQTPILLIIDDLEQILETPQPGQPITQVEVQYRVALGAVLAAFAHVGRRTRSRLLITSRYTFTLADGNGDDRAESLVKIALTPMPLRERDKQWRTAMRLAKRDDLSDEAFTLLQRAVELAGGNPGLQQTLTRPVISGELAVAAQALENIEIYRDTGAPPAEISALIESGAAKDDENAIVQFFARLSYKTYRDALSADEKRLLSAATIFSASIEIPESALVAVGTAHGCANAQAALVRLLGLGMLDDWGESDGERHASVNPLARPLAEPLNDEQIGPLSTAAFNALVAVWHSVEKGFRGGPPGVEAARLALQGEVAPDLLEDAVIAGAAWIALDNRHSRAAFNLLKTALQFLPQTHDFDPGFVRIGIECANALGETDWLDALNLRTLRPKARYPSEYAQLDLRRAERLLSLGDIEQALHLTTTSADWFRANNFEHLLAVADDQIASIYMARGEFDEALRILRERTLPVYELSGDVRAAAMTKGRIADIYMERRELDEALRIWREDELPVYERLGYIHSAAVTKGKIANISAARGELDEALRILHEDTLPVFDRLGDIRSAAITKGQIADIYATRGKLDEALRIRREDELPVYERLGDVFAKSQVLPKIASLLLARDGLNNGEAEEIFGSLAEAFAISRQLGARAGIASVGLLLGGLTAMVGLQEEARTLLDQAEAAYAAMGDDMGVDAVQQVRAEFLKRS